VAKGQKTYRDPLTGRVLPYSSGQQVKHSILDELSSELNEGRAQVIFNWKLTSGKDGKRSLEEGEAWSACDPSKVDQLIGGWMKASKDASEGVAIKRRSPLSISALRPLHPTLAGITSELGTFDRSDHPEQHEIRVTDEKGHVVPPEEFLAFLKSEGRGVPMRKFLPEDQMGPRAWGLFVYDVAIDLRTLFSVSTIQFDPELADNTVIALQKAGWAKNADGTRLVCPKPRRDQIIPALAHSLIQWRVTSNQSRTFSLQNTLAVVISDSANRVGSAIRADLSEEQEWRADPILEGVPGADLYVALTAKGCVRGADATPDALEEAEKDLVRLLSAYDYDG
jgi:hypothetical protein